MLIYHAVINTDNRKRKRTQQNVKKSEIFKRTKETVDKTEMSTN